VPDVTRAINILHLSDLHISAACPEDSYGVFQELCWELRRFRTTSGIHPNLLIVSGDLSHKGTAGYTECVGPRLQEVCAASGCDAKRVFLVPGNHDVCRSRLRRPLYDLTISCLNHDPSLLEKAIEDDVVISSLRCGLDPFLEFASSFPLCCQDSTFGLGFSQHDAEVAGVRIRLCGLNTALIAGPLDEGQSEPRQKNRVVGLRYVKRMLASNDGMAIAVSHYPIEWIHKAERDETRQRLMQRRALLLHGHVHRQESQLLGFRSARQLLTLGAGSV